MIKAYHFVETLGGRAPLTGQVVHAFRTKSDLYDFVRLQGKGLGAAHFKYYEITGSVYIDDGHKDGLQIRVTSYEEINLQYYPIYYE